MNGSNGFRITPRLIIGLAILGWGVLWMLGNMRILDPEPIMDYWPLVLVFIGLAKLSNPRANKGGPIVLMIAGAFLTYVNVSGRDVDFGDLIPLGIALIGAKLVWDALGRRRAPTAISDPNDVVHSFALMAGLHHQNNSQSFRGGDANAIMGGVELDLRNASIRDGEAAVIDAFAMWGGVEITVPETWRITPQVLPLLGGFDDKTANTKSGTGPELIVKGAAVMGAIVVKN